MSRARHLVYSLLRWVFVSVSLVYLARFAYASFDAAQLRTWLSPGMAWRLVLAATLFASTALCSVAGWRILLRHLAHGLSFASVAAIFCITQIAKYLPGNVGHHAGRVALARTQLGIPASASLQSILQESALACLAAILVSTACVLALPADSFPALQRPLAEGWPLNLHHGLYLVLLSGLLALALVNVGRVHFGAHRSRLVNWLLGAAPSWRAVAQALPAYVAIYLVNGVALWVIASALLGVEASDLLLLAGAYSLSWAVGFLLPGAPGGLGVREAALALLLAGSYPPDQIFALSILSRVATVAADIMIFAFGVAISRKLHLTQPPILAFEAPRMISSIRALIGRIAPLVGFKDSRNYWETRYRIGGHSGEGSRGEPARYKAEVINGFLRDHGIESMIEFGCGDGVQLGMFQIPRYTGVDVSKTIIEHCRTLYAQDPGKQFILLEDYRGESAQLAVSLDVIFHLVEDQVYDAYLERLFSASQHYVMIYSTSIDMASTGTPHVRHRDVVADVARRFPQFARMHHAEAALPAPVRFDRGQPTSFFLYQRQP